MKSDKISWVLFGILGLAIVQTIYFQNNQIRILKDVIEINGKSKKIDEDQIRDLIYVIQEEKNKNDEIATRNYVAGIIDCIQKRDYYTEVWHEGFDRGMQNKLMIEEAEKAYVASNKDKK